MTGRAILRRQAVNRPEIDSWLFRARIAIRRGHEARACEALLSALWLMGVEA